MLYAYISPGYNAAATASMAACASSAFGPPACAISGRPPPPLPPRAAEPSRTKSTALFVSVRSSVTATTTDALPASVATIQITALCSDDLISSAIDFNSRAGVSSRRRPTNCTPLISSPAATDPVPAANFRRSCDRSRSLFLRSSSNCATRSAS